MIWTPPSKTMMSKPSYSVSQHISHCCSTNNSCRSSHHHFVAATMLLWWLLHIYCLWLTTLHICCVMSWVAIVLLLWILTCGRGGVVWSRCLLWVHSWWLLRVMLWWVARLLCSIRLRVRSWCIPWWWWPWWIWRWLAIGSLWLGRPLRVWRRRASYWWRYKQKDRKYCLKIIWSRTK